MTLLRAAALAAVLALGVASPALADTLVVDDDGQAVAGDCSAPTSAFALIQAAVDAATDGDTVQVCPGSYAESVAVDVTGLQLLGPQAGVLAKGRSGGEATIAPSAPTDHGVRVLRDDVTVDGFTITNGTPRPAASERYGVCAAQFCAPAGRSFDDGANDTLDDVSVLNNVIREQVKEIDAYFTAGLVVAGNHLIGEADARSIDGVWVAGTSNDASVRNNDIEGHASVGDVAAINLVDGPHVATTIQDNRMVDDNSIVLFDVDGGRVVGNRSLRANGSAILVADGTENVRLEDNTLLDGRYAAIRVSALGGASPRGLTIDGNVIEQDAGAFAADAGPVRGLIDLDRVDGDVRVTANRITLAGELPGPGPAGTRVQAVRGVWVQGNGATDDPHLIVNDNELDGGHADSAAGSDASSGVFVGSTLQSGSSVAGQCNLVTGWVDGIVSQAANGVVPGLNGGNVLQNDGFGAIEDGSTSLVVDGVWWGAASGPGGSGPGTGDEVSGNVDFVPFRDAPSPCAPQLPSVSVADAAATEGAAVQLTVTLSEAKARDTRVRFATQPGTATGADFVARNGTVTIPAGTTQATVSVATKEDARDEPGESFEVVLSNPQGATLAAGTTTATATIDDDDPAPTLGIGDASVREGNAGTGTLTFAVTLSKASGRTVTVAYETADGSAGAPSDYASRSGTLTFAPGQKTKHVRVQVKGDTRNESNETLLVLLSSPVNASIADSDATGGIRDND